MMRIRLSVIATTICLIILTHLSWSTPSVALCLFSCDPTEENARAVLENRLRAAVANAPFKIVEFRKTNGRSVSATGIQGYELFYRAVVEFPSGIEPGRQQKSVWDQLAGMGSNQGSQFALAEMGFRLVKGDKVDGYTLMESNASVSFQKTERGWLGQDGRVY